MKPSQLPFIAAQFEVNDSDKREILSALLTDFGFEGIEDIPPGIVAYIPENQFSEKLLREYLNQFPDFEETSFTHKNFTSEELE